MFINSLAPSANPYLLINLMLIDSVKYLIFNNFFQAYSL